MKICQVLAGNEDGGLEKHTIELSKQLLKKGFDVTVIAHKDFAEFFENINFIPLDLSKSDLFELKRITVSGKDNMMAFKIKLKRGLRGLNK